MSFVPAFSEVVAPGASPTRVGFVLHGILGSGRNWRTFVRRLSREQPDVRWLLVDLRNHGDSQGAPPPHTVTTAADDLQALADAEGAPSVVIGHSFGGKVAARYAQRHPGVLERVWVLDSRLDAQSPDEDNEVLRVIRALRQVPQPLAAREDVVAWLTDHGFSQALAQWMTTNLRRTDGGYVWSFELDAISDMIEDYWSLDLWPVLRAPPCRIDVVRAGLGDRWPDDVVDRYARDAHPDVRLRLLPNAGHWVHVDDPDGLLRMLIAE